MVDASYIGAIFGSIRELKAMVKRINIQNNTVTLQGSLDQIDRARRFIQDIMDANQTETMTVPTNVLGSIMGKRGAQINAIQSQAAPCRINIDNSSGTITFQGPLDRIDRARQLIQQIVDIRAQGYRDYLARRESKAREREQRARERAAKRELDHQAYQQRKANREQRHQEYLERKAARERRQAERDEKRRLWLLYECVEEDTILTVQRSDATMWIAAREVTVTDAVWDGASFTPVLLASLHATRKMITLRLHSGASLTATGNHVMLRADGSQVRLDAVTVGDALLTERGTCVARVECVTACTGRPMELNTESARLSAGGVVVGDSACVLKKARGGEM